MQITPEDFLSIMNTAAAEDNNPAEKPMAGYAAYHPDLGVFLGMTNEVVHWTNLSDTGQFRVSLFDSPETANSYLNSESALGGRDAKALEYFEVASGHWEDLEAVGLPVKILAFNEVQSRLVTHGSFGFA